MMKKGPTLLLVDDHCRLPGYSKITLSQSSVEWSRSIYTLSAALILLPIHLYRYHDYTIFRVVSRRLARNGGLLVG